MLSKIKPSCTRQHLLPSFAEKNSQELPVWPTIIFILHMLLEKLPNHSAIQFEKCTKGNKNGKNTISIAQCSCKQHKTEIKKELATKKWESTAEIVKSNPAN